MRLNAFHKAALAHPLWQKGVFTVLSLAGAALSYLLYPVLARVLTPAQFGDVSIVIALSGQITGLLLAFNVVSIYVVHTRSQAEAVSSMAIIQKLLVQVLLVAAAGVLVAAPWLLGVLKIDSFWTMAGLVIIVLLAVPAVVWTGFLQGHNELTRIGIYNAIVAGAKLVLAAVFCLMGWGAAGAVLGVVGGLILGLWILWLLPGTELPPVHGVLRRIQAQDLQIVKPLAWYVVQSIVVVGAYSFLFAVDIVFAKSLFSQSEAGIYAGVASLGRTIFFGASILIWIMLAGLSPQDLRESRAVVRRYLSLIVGAGLAATAAFGFLASWVVHTSLGANYGEAAALLWPVALDQTLVVALYAYTLYLLVTRQGRPASLAILTGLGALGVLLIQPADTMQLVWGLIIGQMAGAVIYGILVAKDYLTKG